MLKKFLYLFLILSLSLSLLPALAQSDAVVAAIEDYNANLPQGYGVFALDDLALALAERDVFMVDVREVAEYEAGHIEGSINIPIRELPAHLDLLPGLDAEIIIICQGGARAMLAQASLNVLGYMNAKTLAGGFGAWSGADYPTVTEATELPQAGELPEFDADILAAVTDYLSNLPQGFGLIQAADLAVRLVEEPDLILIDTRSAGEWDNGYIEGAEHIWIDEFTARMDEWPEDKDAPIVVYCGAGYRGGIAAVILNLMGYTNVRNLFGGSGAWKAQGFPMVGVPEAEPEAAAEFDPVQAATDYIAGLPSNFNAMRVADLETEMAAGADLLLVDVRPLDEYSESHIEGAINIPIQELVGSLDLLPQDANIVIYCGSGHRSALAVGALNMLGYANARSLLGGTRAWSNAELPFSDVPLAAEAGTMPDVDAALYDWLNEFFVTMPNGFYAVRVDDLNLQLAEQDIVLIDTRTDGEWASGYIEGAIHIPFGEFMSRQADWPQDLDTPIVLYDNPTHRGAIAMMLMRLFGYTDVRTLNGGTGAWTAAGFELVTD